MSARIRDSDLLDALEAHAPLSFSGPVWRVVREGRDPLQCAAPGGRWDDGTFDVLYTAGEAAGAVAELRFHLMRGQPVFPSRVRYRLHELAVALDRALSLADVEAISALGVDTTRWGRLSHADREAEYPRTQDIGEAAHFLGFDGLVVPNARHESRNVVLFCGETGEDARRLTRDHGEVDWNAWD